MDYSEPCKYSIRLVKKLKLLDTENKLDFNLINKAIYWAKKYHADQLRKSGEPFYTHPLEVAFLVSDHSLKTDIIAASLLHDIIEDTKITVDMIIDDFGSRIAEIVDRLTRDRPDGSKLTVKELLNNAYKNNDKEVLLIKVIDRLHNMKNIQFISENKQIHTAQETLDALLPICAYLEDVTTEFTIGSIVNAILSYKKKGDLLNHKTNNKLLSTIHRNHFIDLFKS